MSRHALSIFCPTHKLYHVNEYSSITKNNVKSDIILLRFSNEGVNTIGMVRRSIRLYGKASDSDINGYVIQMSVPCEYGLTKRDGYNLDCVDKRGIMCIATDLQTCQGTNIHESMNLNIHSRLQEDSICCMKTCESLTQNLNMKIGSLFLWKNGKIKDAIICKWIGLINNVECVVGETKSWCECGSSGRYCGVKVFDCKDGHGIMLRVEDIYFKPPTKNRLVIDPNGFINISQTLGICNRKVHDILTVGCRVKVIHNRMNVNVSSLILYGEIRWMGLIDDNMCVGVELDYPCIDGTSGYICVGVSFNCKEKHGIIALADDVELDILSYMPSFTIGEDYKSKFDEIRIEGNNEDNFKEYWDHVILTDKDIEQNSEIYFQIEKKNRKIQRKTKLKWFGQCNSIPIAIIELEFISVLQYNPEIKSLIPPELRDNKRTLIPINPDFIFKYVESQKATRGNKENISFKSYQNDVEEAYREGVKYVLDVIQPGKEVYNNLVENAKDSRILKCLIERSSDWVDIVKYPSMLDELKKLELDDVVNQLTTNCVIDDASDEQLLRLAKVALKNDYSALFHRVIDKCMDVDMIMSDGETFLTGIIKDHLSTKAITMVLDTNKFSATSYNNKSETPMMLVCSNMMVDMVETLVRVIKNQSNMCSICMNRNASIVFECGHNCCKECSDNIDKCHMCTKDITQRGPIFFNN